MNQVENFLDTGVALLTPNMLRTVMLADSYVQGRGPNIHKDETELDASTLRKLQVTLHGGV